MTYGYGYGYGSSFEQGKTDYESPMEYVGQERKDIELAKTIFEMCSQQELQKLGG